MQYILSIFLLLYFVPTNLSAQNTSKTPYPSSLTVAADGSGDYDKISDALMAFRAYSPVPLTLHIKKGNLYRKSLTTALAHQSYH